RFPVDRTHICNCRRDIAAKGIDRNGVAELETKAVSDPFFERNLRRSVVVRRPPLSLDQMRAGGDLIRISEAAVALQYPGRVVPRLDVLRRRAAGGTDAAAEHRHFFELCGRRLRT